MKQVIVIGAGPAGLMAAEVLAAAGVAVHVYDAMPSVGRKFLLAGKGGLNLTHSEPAAIFATRYGARQGAMAPWLDAFGANEVRDWAMGLGVQTFVGTSGRVFPTDMKAAPLLRAWMHRLRHGVTGGGGGPNSGAAGGGCGSSVPVTFHMRFRWVGWDDNIDTIDTLDPIGSRPARGRLIFDTPTGQVQAQADAVVLALGGGSWARLGSDGAWVPLLAARGVTVAPLLPSNCGFDVQGGWSAHFSERFAGQPFKSVALQCNVISTSTSTLTATDTATVTDPAAPLAPKTFNRKGEFVATATGVEGSLVYAASSLLRDAITANRQATFYLDLLPDMPPGKVLAEVAHPRGSRSLSSHLKSRLHLEGIKAGILYERLSKAQMNDPAQLAQAIKALPITLVATRPLDEAISSAGGVVFEAVNPELMLTGLPGVFCAGEMLDWEAPTGGYLLTACLASGYGAGQGVKRFLEVK